MKSGRDVWFTVASRSMAPVLQPGDDVRVASLRSSVRLRFGEIICFEEDGDFFVHRFLGTMSRHGVTWLRTRGDAVRRMDRPVLIGQALGVVRAIKRDDRVINPAAGRGRAAMFLSGLFSLVEVSLFEGARAIRSAIRACLRSRPLASVSS
ncbi:MAG: hypothetical protein EOM20_14255 [Spartobacteria bacterium]|nr:hypothetical protein [Spartobacteria bacterium]